MKINRASPLLILGLYLPACGGSMVGAEPGATPSRFELNSPTIAQGEQMPKLHEFAGFGCSGGNASPELSWRGVPAGTGALALTVYDPDAPTGSGWWHWQLVNIPVDATGLPANAGAVEGPQIPSGSTQTRNDYGQVGFGGACPPEGNGPHRYQFTLHALREPIDVPEGASAALVGYLLNANTIETTRLEAIYER